MDKEKTKVYDLDVNEKDHGVYSIAIVDSPAIDQNFMMFKKQIDNKLTKIEFNSNEFSKDINLSTDKQILCGPAMVPDYKIFRKDAEDNEYYVQISPEQIELVALKFMQGNYNKNANQNHDKNSVIDSITYYESWIVIDPENDKSKALGFKDITKGTWMVSAKIENPEMWNTIKSGNFNGFSIEGLFNLEEQKMNKIPEKKVIYTISKNKNIMLDKILNTIKNALKAEMKTELKFQDLTLQDGTAVSIDQTNGMVTYSDGSTVPDGTYVQDDLIGELFVLNGKSVDQDDFDAAMLDKATSAEPVTVEIDPASMAPADSTDQVASKVSPKPFTVKVIKENNTENNTENEKLKSEIAELKKQIEKFGNLPATSHTKVEEMYRTKMTDSEKEKQNYLNSMKELAKKFEKDNNRK